MKYNKLIRDRIPEIIREKGEDVVVHVADESEFWEKLKEKLLEEIEEFKVSESIEEFADMMEVLSAISAYKGFSQLEVKEVMEQKARERGRFEKRFILDES